MWNAEWDETNVDPTSSLLNHEPPNQHPTIPTCSLKPRFNISSASSRTNILISAQIENEGHVGTKGTRSQMSMHYMSNTVDIYTGCVCVYVCLYMLYCCTGKIVFRVSFCQYSRQKVKTRWAWCMSLRGAIHPPGASHVYYQRGWSKMSVWCRDVHPHPVPQMLQMNLAKSSSNSREEESPIPMDPKKNKPCG